MKLHGMVSLRRSTSKDIPKRSDATLGHSSKTVNCNTRPFWKFRRWIQQRAPSRWRLRGRRGKSERELSRIDSLARLGAIYCAGARMADCPPSLFKLGHRRDLAASRALAGWVQISESAHRESCFPQSCFRKQTGL